VIDLHTHVLPGVDDGCRTLEQSLDLVRAAAADGVEALAATPHVRSDFPTEPGTMERLVAEVRDAVAEAGLAVDVLPGGEIALGRLEELELAELRRFGLGGNPGFLLLEFPYSGWPLDLERRVFDLQATGITPVLAHPERNAAVQADPSRLAQLVGRGVLVQVTAASLEGRLGSSSRSAARVLVESGLAHLLASDAHMPDVRRVGLSGAAETVGDTALARWLTEGVPEAIVSRRRLPERPAPPLRSGGSWFRRMRRL
jgi:protein-tyrosine phosphatase